MKSLVFVLTFLCYQAVCQTVYQPHEVESQAIPVGGVSILNQFILSNIQVPFKSSIPGINKKVFVKGIVELDGSMSSFEIIRGLDSLCDKEAIRVLGLYKAWQSATIKNQKVRQAVIYQVAFNFPPVENFDTALWSFVNYYDRQYLPVKDQKNYKYRSVMPVDEKGYLKGDISYDEWSGGKWKQINSVPYLRKELWYKIHGEPGVDSVKVYQLSAEDNNETNYAPVLTFQMDGKLLAHQEYNAAYKPGLKRAYYLSGMLREVENFEDSSSVRINWYRNGQIRDIVENPAFNLQTISESKVFGSWEANGRQTVKDGNGWWKYSTNEEARILYEEGAVKSGKKDGKWVGKLPDSTVYYVEQFENGVLREGICYVNGEKISYHDKAIQPKFQGGISSMYQFMGQNIKYPSDAARRGISGRVRLSFTVCEDGSLCDYKVEKGVVRDMDEEALRVIKKMSGKWEPGEMRGQKVRVRYNLPVNFQLQ